MFAALWMGIVLAALMVLDIGNLVWQKRELQKIADLSALAGATGDLDKSCRNQPSASAQNVAKANGWKGEGSEELDILPGSWSPNGGELETFFQPTGVANACRVTISRSIPYFFIWKTGAANRLVNAQAIAVQKSRIAQLSVRSKLLALASKNSPLLNILVGGLLGGKIDLDVMSWEGLAGLDLELLDFLDALKIELGLEAGGYDDLLKAPVKVGVLLDVAADVLSREGNTAQVAVEALNKIANVALKVPSLQLKLVEILGLSTGGGDAALNTGVNVLELVMATVQAGNRNNALSGAVNVPLGIANVALALKVIEPPQVSLAKDPELARQDPYGVNKIFVRTAQTRILLSVDLPVLNLATGILDVALAA
ncbi:MAG: TadG family pilus assembly protein, partial [Comamonas sp.]